MTTLTPAMRGLLTHAIWRPIDHRWQVPPTPTRSWRSVIGLRERGLVEFFYTFSQHNVVVLTDAGEQARAEVLDHEPHDR